MDMCRTERLSHKPLPAAGAVLQRSQLNGMYVQWFTADLKDEFEFVWQESGGLAEHWREGNQHACAKAWGLQWLGRPCVTDRGREMAGQMQLGPNVKALVYQAKKSELFSVGKKGAHGFFRSESYITQISSDDTGSIIMRNSLQCFSVWKRLVTSEPWQ